MILSPEYFQQVVSHDNYAMSRDVESVLHQCFPIPGKTHDVNLENIFCIKIT